MSGSLLGVELNDVRSAPVGYMRILDMSPLDFGEFIKAVGVQAKTIALLKAFVFSNANVDIVGKRIYMPVYMCMFLENIALQDSVYKLDLRGI